MWVFIKANAGSKKFDFESKKNTIWFSIEKTERERLVAEKTGYLVKALTDFYRRNPRSDRKGGGEVHRRGLCAGLRHVLGASTRDKVRYNQRRYRAQQTQLRIFDSRSGITYWTPKFGAGHHRAQGVQVG